MSEEPQESVARLGRFPWLGWQACEVVKLLPEQQVMAQNGANGHGEHCTS